MPRTIRKNIRQYTENELLDFIDLYNDCRSMKELQKRSAESTDQVSYLVGKLQEYGLIEPIHDDRQKRRRIDWFGFFDVYFTCNTMMEVALQLGVEYKEIKRRITVANKYGLDIPFWPIGFEKKVENNRHFVPSPHSGNPQDMARKLAGGRYDDMRGAKFERMSKLTVYKAQQYIAKNAAKWAAVAAKMKAAKR